MYGDPPGINKNRKVGIKLTSISLWFMNVNMIFITIGNGGLKHQTHGSVCGDTHNMAHCNYIYMYSIYIYIVIQLYT